MINRQAVFRKSNEGVEAVATRQRGLPHRLRATLIMVDGKRTFEELAPLVSMLGDAEELLGELQALGLVESASDRAAAPAAAATHAAPRAAGSAAATGKGALDDARRVASRLLIELVGPSSEPLCLKIEASRDLPEFVAAVKRAIDVIRDVRGQAAAAQFVSQVEAHTPGS